MSSHRSKKEQRIPLGLALLGIGAVVLLFAFFGWVAWGSVHAPGDLPPVLRSIPTRMAQVGVPWPEPAGSPSSTASTTAPILLPESPTGDSITARYPSHATLAEAGKSSDPVPGQPLHITIPGIGVDAPVSAVGLEQVTIDGQPFQQWAVPPRYEGGWHTGSARLGEPGNTVINGHNNTLGEVFRNLVKLEAGDEIVVADAANTYRYAVEQVLTLPEQGQPTVVRVENSRWIEPTVDERLTLVSCWPYETNAYRLVVVARPASPSGPSN